MFFYIAAYAAERPVGKSRDTYEIIDVLITEIAGAYFLTTSQKTVVKWKTRSRSSGVGVPELESWSRSPGV